MLLKKILCANILVCCSFPHFALPLLLVYLLVPCQLNPRKCELSWATKWAVERGWIVGNTHAVFGMGASSQNCSQRVCSLRIILCEQCMRPWPFRCRRMMNQPTLFSQFSNGYKQASCIPTPVVISARNIFSFWSDCAEQSEQIRVSYLLSQVLWSSMVGTSSHLAFVSFDVSKKWKLEPRTSRINKLNTSTLTWLQGFLFFLCYQLSLAVTCVFGICNDTRQLPKYFCSSEATLSTCGSSQNGRTGWDPKAALIPPTSLIPTSHANSFPH